MGKSKTDDAKVNEHEHRQAEEVGGFFSGNHKISPLGMIDGYNHHFFPIVAVYPLMEKVFKKQWGTEKGRRHNVTIEIKEGVVVLEWIWMMGIIAVAIGAAVGMEWYQRRCRRRKREWQIEDKAIRFGEEGYIEGVVPIGKVKALAGLSHYNIRKKIWRYNGQKNE